MGIRLIALDMDGTTLADDHVTLPDCNRIAIERAISKGIQVVTATGRMRYRLPASIEKIKGMQYAVTSNGGAVWDLIENKKLYENAMPAALVVEIIDQLLSMGAYLELYYEGSSYAQHKDEALWNSFPVDPARRKLMMRNRFLVDDLRSFVLDGEKQIEKVNLPYLFAESAPQITAQMKQMVGVHVTSSIPQNAEINLAGSNKADGLAYLCKLLGISPREVLAVGDNGNDLEMLQFAGCCAVPCNGLEVCQKLATLITCDNNTGAVAQAIEHFI